MTAAERPQTAQQSQRPAGGDTLGEGLIPGVEFLAFAGTPRENVTLMVQGPDSFAPADA